MSYRNVTSLVREAPGRAGARTCTKKGEGLGFLLGSGHRKSPGTCSGGHLPLPTAPAPLGVIPTPLGVIPTPAGSISHSSGSVSCSFWECSPLFWDCSLLLLGTAPGQPQHFLPHPTILTRPRARHSTSPDTEAPRLKCYKPQCQSPSEHCLSLLLLLFTLPTAVWCCLSSSAHFPRGVDSQIQPGHAASP